MNVSIDPKIAMDKDGVFKMQFSTGEVVSSDSTHIGYRQTSSGPGLVVLHGGMRASQHYLALAETLADRYTVYIPDRRGRGLSGPPGDGYSIEKELDDIQAILKATGANWLFGHSAGGFFAAVRRMRDTRAFQRTPC